MISPESIRFRPALSQFLGFSLRSSGNNISMAQTLPSTSWPHLYLVRLLNHSICSAKYGLISSLANFLKKGTGCFASSQYSRSGSCVTLSINVSSSIVLGSQSKANHYVTLAEYLVAGVLGEGIDAAVAHEVHRKVMDNRK